MPSLSHTSLCFVKRPSVKYCSNAEIATANKSQQIEIGLPVVSDSAAASASIWARRPSTISGLIGVPEVTARTKCSNSKRSACKDAP